MSSDFVPTVRLVARREFVERVRERSFAISTGITVLILVAVVVLPRLLGGGGQPTYDVAASGRSAAALSSAVEAAARAADVRVRTHQAPADAAAALREGRLDAVVGDAGIQVTSSLPTSLGQVLQAAHRQVRAAAGLAARGIDPGQVAAAFDVAPLPVRELVPGARDADTRRGIATISVVVLYSQLLGYGLWVALGVVEEKSSRVVEVLLAAIRPRALLTGKIIGIGLLALLQLAILAAVGVGAASASGTLKITATTVSAVLLVLPWFVLGYAFYACLFAATAARVSRQEDVQNVTSPLTLVILVSFFAAFYAASNPTSTAATILSVVPPFSALVSPPRMAAGSMPVVQIGLAVLLMLVVTALLVRVAARLYEGAVLRMGAKVAFRDAWHAGRR